MKTHITTTDQERNMGMFTHISTFLGYFFPFANVLAPWIIWLSNKESPFISKHGKSVLNFQLSLLLYQLIGAVFLILFFLADIKNLVGEQINSREFERIIIITDFTNPTITALLIFLLYFLILQAFYIITTIIGSVKASKGEEYIYPLNIRFIR